MMQNRIRSKVNNDNIPRNHREIGICKEPQRNQPTIERRSVRAARTIHAWLFPSFSSSSSWSSCSSFISHFFPDLFRPFFSSRTLDYFEFSFVLLSFVPCCGFSLIRVRRWPTSTITTEGGNCRKSFRFYSFIFILFVKRFIWVIYRLPLIMQNLDSGMKIGVKKKHDFFGTSSEFTFFLTGFR